MGLFKIFLFFHTKSQLTTCSGHAELGTARKDAAVDLSPLLPSMSARSTGGVWEGCGREQLQWTENKALQDRVSLGLQVNLQQRGQELQSTPLTLLGEGACRDPALGSSA